MRALRNSTLALLAAGMAAFAVYHAVRAQQVPPPLPPPSEPVRSPFARTTAAEGLVEARTENIAIGATWAGTVLEVKAQVGQRVAAGSLLFRLDDRHLAAQLKVQEANLAVAQAQLAKLEGMPRREDLPPA